MQLKILFLPLLVFIGACSTPHGLYADRDKARAQLATVINYCNSLPSKEDLEALNGKWGTGGAGSKPSLEQMNDSTYATEREQAAISSLRNTFIKCGDALMMWAANEAPAAAGLMREYLFQRDQVQLDLYARRVTFGQAISRLSNLDKALIDSMNGLDGEIFARQKADNARNTKLFIEAISGGGSSAPRPVQCMTTGTVTQCF